MCRKNLSTIRFLDGTDLGHARAMTMACASSVLGKSEALSPISRSEVSRSFVERRAERRGIAHYEPSPDTSDN